MGPFLVVRISICIYHSIHIHTLFVPIKVLFSYKEICIFILAFIFLSYTFLYWQDSLKGESRQKIELSYCMKA